MAFISHKIKGCERRSVTVNTDRTTVCAEKPRYAESWDFEVSGSSFLQFELSMGCSKSTSFSHGVRLEYSTDCGHHWSLITPECVPPAIGCAGYTQSSVYTSTQYKHWRRITVYLPSAAKCVFFCHFLFPLSFIVRNKNITFVHLLLGIYIFFFFFCFTQR